MHDIAIKIALIGAAGIAAQWLAWRLHLPAIVLMLAAGVVIGPVAGVLDPGLEFSALVQPLVALAVAVILFEGGLTFDLRKLGDARAGVFCLVVIGGPLGWLLSTLALRYGAGLSWEASTVFGGVIVVTGPTVIAPLLRQARFRSSFLPTRPWSRPPTTMPTTRSSPPTSPPPP